MELEKSLGFSIITLQGLPEATCVNNILTERKMELEGPVNLMGKSM